MIRTLALALLMMLTAGLAVAQDATAPEAPAAVMPAPAPPVPAKPAPCKTGEVANGPEEAPGAFVCQAGEWRRVPEAMLRKGLGADADFWQPFLLVISFVALAMFVAYKQSANVPALKNAGTYLMVGSAVLGSVAFGVWQYTEGVSPIAILVGAGVIAGVGGATGGAVGLRRAVAKAAKGGG